MVVARLESCAPVKVMKLTSSKSANKSGTAKTFKLQKAHQHIKSNSINDEYQVSQPIYEPIQDFSCPLFDFSSIGQHFLVKSTSFNRASPSGSFDKDKGGVKRQYTQAFTMIPEVYQLLIKLANDPSNSQTKLELKGHISNLDNDSLYLTLKSYDLGLSSYIHEDLSTRQQLFEVKGRMGLPLGL